MSATIVTDRPMVNIYRASPRVGVIDIEGDLTAESEEVLVDAYNRAAVDNVQTVILDFARLEYMNSTGIGLLVTLLIRANRQSRRLVAVGLNEHYRNIFELTRLNEAIRVFDSVADATRS